MGNSDSKAIMSREEVKKELCEATLRAEQFLREEANVGDEQVIEARGEENLESTRNEILQMETTAPHVTINEVEMEKKIPEKKQGDDELRKWKMEIKQQLEELRAMAINERTKAREAEFEAQQIETKYQFEIYELKQKIEEMTEKERNKEKPSKQNHAEISDLIPEFEPMGRRPFNIQQWIETVDDIISSYKVDDKIVMAIMRRKMIGEAKDWFMANVKVNTTWKEMKQKVITRFERTFSVYNKTIKMMNHKRAPGQTLSAYYYEMEAMAMGKMEEHAVVDLIMKGSNNRALETMARNRNKMSLEELLDTIWDIMDESQAQYKPRREPDARFSNQTARDDNNRPKCFNCGVFGHVAKYCRKASETKTQSCYNCGKQGHIARQCGEERKQINQQETKIPGDNNSWRDA